MLISVVIPIYKVEQYLEECIKSVVSQTYKNLEIILVDDGSPDQCPLMCDKWAAKDNRIRVIHKANGGLSDARNVGIDAATGEYVLFLDSDDYWSDTQAVEKLVKCHEKHPNAELIFFGFISNGQENRLDVDAINNQNKIEALKEILIHADFAPSAWMKLTKRDVLIKNHIRFRKGMKSEDFDYSINLYLHVTSIAAISDSFYVYRKREGSITATIDASHIKDLIWFLEFWSMQLKRENLDEAYIQLYYGYLAYIYSQSLALLSRISKQDKQKLEIKLFKLENLLEYTINPKVRHVAQICKLFGLKFTSKFLQHYYKYRQRLRSHI
jgi:glycosyltransferase involved in cell wall biosynthesis